MGYSLAFGDTLRMAFTSGLGIDEGIGYSDESQRMAEKFAVAAEFESDGGQRSGGNMAQAFPK